jgi:hypothetical protein
MRSIPLFLLALASACNSEGQAHKVGLMLGRISGPSRSSPSGELHLDSGIALQANYAYRVLQRSSFALAVEAHFLANGQREIRSTDPAVTRDVATLFLTPGLRVEFLPRGRIRPYVALGAGYALYEQSHFRIDGSSNPAPRFTHRGAVTFGGGIDVPVWRWLHARVQIRDFYTGNPSFNSDVRGFGQHNVVAGGGFVLSWGGE